MKYYMIFLVNLSKHRFLMLLLLKNKECFMILDYKVDLNRNEHLPLNVGSILLHGCCLGPY